MPFRSNFAAELLVATIVNSAAKGAFDKKSLREEDIPREAAICEARAAVGAD